VLRPPSLSQYEEPKRNNMPVLKMTQILQPRLTIAIGTIMTTYWGKKIKHVDNTDCSNDSYQTANSQNHNVVLNGRLENMKPEHRAPNNT